MGFPLFPGSKKGGLWHRAVLNDTSIWEQVLVDVLAGETLSVNIVPLGSGEHPIPRDQRLTTVKYLLNHGFYMSEVQIWNGVRGLKDELENTPSTDPEYEYYGAVVACLDDMTQLIQRKTRFTWALERLRSGVGFLIRRK
ncbi:uncharacterized protein NECHADRAFT_87444 [Fusarium vanettenii 77-13-4]|uniref:Uncharacterized protein n=1 Tax=Fusarium vanettenii (strain ATCC MYA-4622 / CBS 123669 / FGSC 9596 / NRRL 45880 / 77-13-4) TaxID=660122 RepID=C7ZE50_FUSV7|nr:uncharacterized protein NECHADRAFT_87444 [Fusarium vanettenii 77-13-4]EEU37672.1 predicted protein [Fusarium vanettenii 77-13-4]